jgi:hypothetical protein
MMSAALLSPIQRVDASRKPAPAGMLQRACACGGNPGPTGECAACRAKRLGLQRAAAAPTQSATVPSIVHQVLASPGRPLEASARAYMEPRFGHDFSQVRVHTDAIADKSARTVNALAYTVGRNVVFQAGRFASHTESGRKLLAHELTHVIQQDHQTPGLQRQLFVGASTDEHEREAERTAAVVARGGDNRTVRASSSGLGLLRRAEGSQEECLTGCENDFGRCLASNMTPGGVFCLAHRSTCMSNCAPPPPPAPTAETAPAPEPRNDQKCEEFPGGSTDCEVSPTTGTPTGKVVSRIDETNPCTRPCVEAHEAVHVKQFKTLCPQLRACYLAADAGKRPAADCFKMAVFGIRERECEAYTVSVGCVEKRLRDAKLCQTAANKEYGARKLASEKCFFGKNCGASGEK